MKKRLAIFFIVALLLLPLALADEYKDEKEYDAGYTAFAVVGVGLTGAGVSYYALTKRKLLIKHRKGDKWGFEIQPEHPYVTFIGPVSPMTVHHTLTITGTLLVFVHFLSCGNYSGMGGVAGLSMGVTLIALNALGFIGRTINRKILSRKVREERRCGEIRQEVPAVEEGSHSSRDSLHDSARDSPERC